MNMPIPAATIVPTTPTMHDATAAPEAKNQAPQLQQLEKHSIKINGQMRELTTAELKQIASKSMGAEERFQKASEIEKQSKELREAFSSKDVRRMAASLGVDVADVRSMLEDSLIPLIEEELLSPQERERMAKDKRLKEYEDRDLSEKEKREQEKHGREVYQARQQFEAELSDSLTKQGYPNDPFLGGQVAQYMMSALQEGYEVSCAEATELVVERYQDNLLKQLSKLSPEMLKKHLPKDLHKALRESDVKSVRDAESIFTTTTNRGVNATRTSDKSDSQKVSIKQAFEQLRQQHRKK